MTLGIKIPSLFKIYSRKDSPYVYHMAEPNQHHYIHWRILSHSEVHLASKRAYLDRTESWNFLLSCGNISHSHQFTKNKRLIRVGWASASASPRMWIRNSPGERQRVTMHRYGLEGIIKFQMYTWEDGWMDVPWRTGKYNQYEQPKHE